jgi:hypothetical protein
MTKTLVGILALLAIPVVSFGLLSASGWKPPTTMLNVMFVYPLLLACGLLGVKLLRDVWGLPDRGLPTLIAKIITGTIVFLAIATVGVGLLSAPQGGGSAVMARIFSVLTWSLATSIFLGCGWLAARLLRGLLSSPAQGGASLGAKTFGGVLVLLAILIFVRCGWLVIGLLFGGYHDVPSPTDHAGFGSNVVVAVVVALIGGLVGTLLHTIGTGVIRRGSPGPPAEGVAFDGGGSAAGS